MLKASVNSDAEYVAAHGTLSESLEVVHTLGFSDTGDQIHDKAASEKEGKRVLAPVGRIVGYEIKNNSKQPIPYTTYACTPRENGGYDSTEVEATLAPGKTAVISKKHLIKLASDARISFVMANAHFRKAPNQKINSASVDTIEDAFFLSFNKDENGKGLADHSDKVKRQIGEKDGDGKWKVKKEYAQVLGYVENEKPVKERGTGSKVAGPKFSSRDAQALFVAKLFEGAGSNM